MLVEGDRRRWESLAAFVCGVWVGPNPLYQAGSSVAVGDMSLEPLFDGIRQVDRVAAEMNAGQAMIAFEVLGDVAVIPGTADLGDAEEPDQFLFCHDGGTGRDGW